MITSMIDQISSVQSLGRTNTVCIVWYTVCTSIKTQTFVGNHCHCRWNISIFNRKYIFNPGLFFIPMLPEGTSLAHATFSDSGPQFPPDTLQHMTDGCGPTLGTFFGLCEGRPLSQPMGPPKKGTPWENKLCKMFFGNCGCC